MKLNPYQSPESFLRSQREKPLTTKELIARVRQQPDQTLSWTVGINTITATLLPPGNTWSKKKEVFILSSGFGKDNEISDFIDIGATGKFNKVRNGVVGILAKNFAAKLLLQLIPAENFSSNSDEGPTVEAEIEEEK